MEQVSDLDWGQNGRCNNTKLLTKFYQSPSDIHTQYIVHLELEEEQNTLFHKNFASFVIFQNYILQITGIIIRHTPGVHCLFINNCSFQNIAIFYITLYCNIYEYEIFIQFVQPVTTSTNYNVNVHHHLRHAHNKKQKYKHFLLIKL